MMYQEEQKFVKAVVTMIKLTSEDKMKWSEVTSIAKYESRSRKGITYQTDYNEKTLHLFEEVYPHYTDEDEFTMHSKITLVFVNSQNEYGYEFPHLGASWDLYKKVQYKTQKIDDFLNDLSNYKNETY